MNVKLVIENISSKIRDIFFFHYFNNSINFDIYIIKRKIMSKNFQQISIQQGFMKHNGGVLFRNISETEYEFKSTINKNHLNAAGITHGGYLSALVDAGAGTAAHRCAENAPCVTISLDLKFIGPSKTGDEIIGNVKILKKTKTLVFLFCELKCNDKIITSATGVWKILKKS